MDIINKLELSKQPIAMFKEGQFLKLYNHSFYVAKHYLNSNLKPVVRYIKQIDQIVVYGGFPVSSLAKRFPLAIPTAFGYQLSQNNWDLSGYYLWYQAHCKLVNPNKELIDPRLNFFSQQQIDFLTNWEQDNHQRFDHIEFIQSLKNTFQL